MRVALLCPYSLSRPGGVQGQVLGLARALRAAGHDAVVLAPADGDLDLPGLDPGTLVPLGRSVGLRANGSVAPVALGPGATGRAVRTVKQGGFDVLHLHEPLAPGPGYGCLVACDLPKIGTFHRAGPSVAYRLLGPLARALAARLTARCAVSAEAEATARHALGGAYEIIGNGIDLERFSGAPTSRYRGPHRRLRRSPRRAQGSGRPTRGHGAARPRHRPDGVDGGGGARHREPAPPTRSQRPARCGWVGSTTTSWRPGWPGRRRCAPRRCGASPSAWCCSRPWRRVPRWWRAIFPGTAPWWVPTACSFPPVTSVPWRRALESVAADAAPGTGRCAPDALDAAVAPRVTVVDARGGPALRRAVYERVRDPEPRRSD